MNDENSYVIYVFLLLPKIILKYFLHTTTLKHRLAVPYKAEQSYHAVQQSYIQVFTQMNWKHAHIKTFTQMFTTAWFKIAKHLETTKSRSFSRERINYLTFIQCNIIQQLKQMSYQALKRHSGTLNAYC